MAAHIAPYLEGLTFGAQEALPETRSGMPLYSGSAHRFTEWKFKVKNRMRAVEAVQDAEIKVQKQATLVSSVIDALSDDALKIAMDMSEEELAAATATQDLMNKIEDHTSRFKIDEARELHRAGTRTTGPLCRQNGEPMSSYISRRRRWYKRLRAMDPTTVVSENILSDQLIDCANMNEQEKLSVRTLSGESTAFDVIAGHMTRICRAVHEKESRKGFDGAKSSAHEHRSSARRHTNFRALGNRGWHPNRAPVDRNPKFNRFKPKAHNAIMSSDECEEDEEEEESQCAWTVVAADGPEDEDSAGEEHDLRCYNVQTTIDPDMWTSVEDQIAHDVVQCFISAGDDVENPEHASQIAQCYNADLESFYARDKARNHGVKVAQQIHGYRPRSELSFDERKRKLGESQGQQQMQALRSEGPLARGRRMSEEGTIWRRFSQRWWT